MGTFTIFRGTNSQFYFNLKSRNGEKILHSEGYGNKSSCETGIRSVKDNAPDDSRYEKGKSSNDKYYFVLKASNGEIIGTSEMYEHSSGRDNGIEAVKKEAPISETDDLNSN